MSVFLTPDGRPFYGGTYFPDTPRHGMPSFRQVLEGVREAWTTQRAEVEQAGVRLVDTLVESQRIGAGGGAAAGPAAARGARRGRRGRRRRRSTRSTAAGGGRRSSRSR